MLLELLRKVFALGPRETLFRGLVEFEGARIESGELLLVDLLIDDVARQAAGPEIHRRSGGMGEGPLVALAGFCLFDGRLRGLDGAPEFFAERRDMVEGAVVLCKIVNGLGKGRGAGFVVFAHGSGQILT